MRSVAGLVVSLCLFSVISGCADSADMSEVGGEKLAMPAEAMAEASDSNEVALSKIIVEGEIGQDGEAKPNIKPEQIQRQIIYTARLNLIVEEFDGIPEMVEKLASRHSGFIADSTLEGSSGSPRSGTLRR